MSRSGTYPTFRLKDEMSEVGGVLIKVLEGLNRVHYPCLDIPLRVDICFQGRSLSSKDEENSGDKRRGMSKGEGV